MCFAKPKVPAAPPPVAPAPSLANFQEDESVTGASKKLKQKQAAAVGQDDTNVTKGMAKKTGDVNRKELLGD